MTPTLEDFTCFDFENKSSTLSRIEEKWIPDVRGIYCIYIIYIYIYFFLYILELYIYIYAREVEVPPDNESGASNMAMILARLDDVYASQKSLCDQLKRYLGRQLGSCFMGT